MKEGRRYLNIILLLFVLFTSIIWIVKIMNDSIPFVDQWSREFVEALADSNYYVIFRWLTELGSGTFLTPFTIILAIVLWNYYRDWFVGIMFAGGTFISHLVNVGIKVIVERPRPRIFAEAEAEGYSFPSGHAMISMVCYGLLVYFITRKIKSFKVILAMHIGAAVLIVLIGISRYMIRVHYLTDVIAGFVFGFIFIVLWLKLYEFIQDKRSHP